MGGRGARSPGDRADVGGRPVVPQRAADDVVAVGQRRDATATDAVRSCGADEAVRCADRSAEAGRAAGPGGRTRIDDQPVVPERVADDVVAIGQSNDGASAEVAAGAADEAVRRAHLAGEASGAIDERCGTNGRASCVPRRTEDHEIAGTNLGDAFRPDLVTGRRAGDLADRRIRHPVVQVHRADVERRGLIEETIDHDIVAIRQDQHLAAELPAQGVRALEINNRRGVRCEGAQTDHHGTYYERCHGG